ncbi:MAG: RNA polymerase factor sigma-54 [Candidatus Omnitrophica bacterium]|nr:RNA polymerase factor sigma-54 [Candidatus Omnitrophota bacterium]
MAFEQRLTQIQTQKLILSPQIKQYLKLLQLPLLELQHTVEQELAENPALEELPADNTFDQQTDQEAAANEKTQELDFQETFEKLSSLDDELQTTLYSDQNTKLQSLDDLDKKQRYKESLINKPPTLSDYLSSQLGFLELDEQEKKIALHIIGNIDDNGYLTTSCDELAQSLNESSERITSVLLKVQTLDPPGVGARDLKECLLIQLKQYKQDAEAHLAQQILIDHFTLLEKRDFPQIAKVLSMSGEKIEKACALITSLEPKPGRSFVHDEATSIVPDASVYPNDEEEGKYIIDIHDERLPHLRISNQYKKLIKDKTIDKKTKEYLKSKINAAFWFIKAMDQRKSTLREITEHIVQVQSNFFERGFAFINPLRLKDIAARIGIHESTVSRALAQKFINTPHGTIPYKMFFSQKMETEDGSLESQKSITEKMKFLIENENLSKPYSDSKLVTLLKARGIKIARRTVAKYREILRILPSHMRRKK